MKGRRIATLFTALFLAISPLFSQEAEEPSVLAPALVTPAPDTSAYIRFIRDTSATALTRFEINDYSMIGINYGVTLSQMSFNPSQKQSMLFSPVYVSLMYTHYMKMFQYMPYFGFQIGVAYGKEGYKFKENKETGTVYKIEGATQAVMQVVEVPFLMQLHFDSENFKVMASGGLYGGYRMSIERTGASVTPGLENAFATTDRRWDYGLQGGAGFGIVKSPVEFHVTALLRYSWSSIYTPDSSPSIYNKYYYRFAYPFDITVMAGVHIHLSKRSGWSTARLKAKAREIVENDLDLDILEAEARKAEAAVLVEKNENVESENGE